MNQKYVQVLNKEEKGITLIALVITIIVLLILAGVSISMLSGDNGIIKQASEAKSKSELEQVSEEIKLATIAVLTDVNHSLNENEFIEEIEKKGYNVDENGALTYNNEKYMITNKGLVKATINDLRKESVKVAIKSILLDDNDEQIVIPSGFRIKEDSPITVKEGIVVVGPDNSEFVWVPVTDVNKMAKKMRGKDENGRDNYQGKLYEFSSVDGVYSANERTDYGQGTTGYREPTLITGKNDDTYAVVESVTGTYYDAKSSNYNTILGYNDAIEFGKDMQKDYNEMVESVSNNKGFYIGRYETSLNKSGNAQSISGEVSVTAGEITWYGLYKKDKEYSKNNYLTETLGSSMLWGSQYDQIMIWMQSNGIDVTLANPVNLEGVTTSKNNGNEGKKVGVTGSVETDKLNNIYDLLGNGTETTLTGWSGAYRVIRGGSYNPVSITKLCYAGQSTSEVSKVSRITLYIK